MIIHYRDGDGALQRQSTVGITEEKGHIMVTTLAFLLALQPQLKAIFLELTHAHYVTDSPSNQHRNKTAVAMFTNHRAFSEQLHHGNGWKRVMAKAHVMV